MEHYEVVTVEGKDVFRYMKAIPVVEPCLTCHGDAEEMDPAVIEAIREMYPEDAATGYDVGDLRGLIRVGVSQDRIERAEGGKAIG